MSKAITEIGDTAIGLVASTIDGAAWLGAGVFGDGDKYLQSNQHKSLQERVSNSATIKVVKNPLIVGEWIDNNVGNPIVSTAQAETKVVPVTNTETEHKAAAEVAAKAEGGAKTSTPHKPITPKNKVDDNHEEHHVKPHHKVHHAESLSPEAQAFKDNRPLLKLNY